MNPTTQQHPSIYKAIISYYSFRPVPALNSLPNILITLYEQLTEFRVGSVQTRLSHCPVHTPNPLSKFTSNTRTKLSYRVTTLTITTVRMSSKDQLARSDSATSISSCTVEPLSQPSLSLPLDPYTPASNPKALGTFALLRSNYSAQRILPVRTPFTSDTLPHRNSSPTLPTERKYTPPTSSSDYYNVPIEEDIARLKRFIVWHLCTDYYVPVPPAYGLSPADVDYFLTQPFPLRAAATVFNETRYDTSTRPSSPGPDLHLQLARTAEALGVKPAVVLGMISNFKAGLTPFSADVVRMAYSGVVEKLLWGNDWGTLARKVYVDRTVVIPAVLTGEGERELREKLAKEALGVQWRWFEERREGLVLKRRVGERCIEVKKGWLGGLRMGVKRVLRKMNGKS
ncbi:hypothetical protein M501DRAFT_57754 [Patellaria atrata CBS 101060]|uniref:Uncharacterized protein n=1 Tax=Patellaria atrata CBS 101060 TaxID=1346257 RepID=A0A9P4SHL6_9PEZI|nr:hypothetical protein M501DRAFT_57754 [Patellaria atrata CBS 101060]